MPIGRLRSGALVLSRTVTGATLAAAQSTPEPPDGTIAAELQARRGDRPVHRDLIDVTAVSTTLVAIDDQGRAVLDLRPEELTVLEDNQEVRILSLEPGLGSDEVAPPAPTAASSGSEVLAAPRPWRVVVYVSTELAGRFVLPDLCRRTADEASRLTGLGPVEVVMADPTPTLYANAGYEPENVRRALEDLADDASGITTVERIRNLFTQDFRPGVGFNRQYTSTQSSPQTFATRARASALRERTIIRGELDRMVAWMESQPPAARGLLVWMTGGFDLNPADFYIPLVEQIDSGLATALRSDYPYLSLENDVKQMVEVALSQGWTVLPLSSSRTTFIYGAEVAGTGKVQHHQGVGAGSLSTQQGNFRQVAPNYPLQIIARATGGELVATSEQFAGALDHIRGAYFVTYQVERPADGRLHTLEIRCARPGVKLRGRRYAASGSLRGVAATRAQRLLGGDQIGGALGMTAEVRNITRAEKGLRVADLSITADLGELRPVLSPVGLGVMRVTVVVEIESGSPFIHHQEIDLDWSQVAETWHFGAGFTWPRKATRAAVVVEELVSSTWGATTVELR